MVTLINDHVLFPNPCNWTRRPEWSRQWENEVAGAVTGAESRRALRAQPLIGLTFSVLASNEVERAMLAERILAAVKSGQACAPLHGRGVILTADASGDEITVRAGRTWTVGEYIFLQARDESYEVLIVESAVLDAGVWTLGLSDTIAGEYAAGQFVWPLLFGKLDADDFGARNPRVGPTRLTIRENVSSASTQLGAVAPPGGTGIGSMAIGSTFVVS